MSNVSAWSTTPANNDSAPPDGAPENMTPAAVNDVIRENMSATKKWYLDTNGTLVSAGTSTAYTLTTNNAHATLAAQSAIVFRVNQNNTGSSTLDVDSLGAKTMKLDGENLSADDLVANSIVIAVYNADQDVYDIIKSSSATQPTIARSARTSNTIFGVADNNTLVDFTANTFTQTFTAAATLGAGWFVYLKNSGTGDITLDPNGSETIDGLTSFVMYPGEHRLVQCDGSNFTSVVLSPFKKSFTSSGTFTKPPGYKLFSGLLWGAGAGGDTGTAAGSSGGGGGACAPFNFPASDLSATETVTIGAGGATDSNGGNSTFGSLLTSYGGAAAAAGDGGGGGGVFSAGTTTAGGDPVGGVTGATEDAEFGGGAGGDAVGGDGGRSVYGGGGGGARNGGNPQAGGDGGASLFGGGGGGGGTHNGTQSGGAGGASSFGGNGGAGSNSGVGTAGSQPGGGGGGGVDGSAGGVGGDGQCDIWGVA